MFPAQKAAPLPEVEHPGKPGAQMLRGAAACSAELESCDYEWAFFGHHFL